MKNATPCPIPQCALEVFLGAWTIVLGAGILLCGGNSSVSRNLILSGIPQEWGWLAWASLLMLVGALQLVSLRYSPRIMHRHAAFVCSFILACFVITESKMGRSHVPITAYLASFTCIGEAYVFWMLKGATWGNGNGVVRSSR